MRSRLAPFPTLAVIVGASLCGSSLAAQEAPAPDSPPVLQVGVETVRAGRGSQHRAVEQTWAQTFSRAGVPVYWVGTTAVTGPNEFWWFTPLGSIGELDQQDKAVAGVPGLETSSDLLSKADAENVSATRSFLVRYRPDLSRPGGTPVPQARYFQMITWRARPGHTSAFEDAAKLYMQVVTDAKASANWVTYEAASGIPDGTYFVFIPMKSLSEVDPGPDFAAIQKSMTPARLKQFNDLAAAGYISVTNMILRIEPRMSNVPAAISAVDPEFWNVRP